MIPPEGLPCVGDTQLAAGEGIRAADPMSEGECVAEDSQIV